jgi:hypothetical protein
VSFARRGFTWKDPAARHRLELIGSAFLDGYHAALDDDRPDSLAHRLTAVDLERRGFAFEGAAMALVLVDRLTPWRASRFEAFLAGPGSPHIFMLLVGSGWALARLHRPIEGWAARRDPLLGWLAIDGYGFHEAYFNRPAAITRQRTPAHLSAYGRRVFDQGLGRGLWFVNGADAASVAASANTFPSSRQADVWSGIGLACAYAGGTDQAGLGMLRQASGPWRPHLAQGAAFAAAARWRAGNPAEHTDLACLALGGASATCAAAIVSRTRLDLPFDGAETAYETWRHRIRSEFIRRDLTS